MPVQSPRSTSPRRRLRRPRFHSPEPRWTRARTVRSSSGTRLHVLPGQSTDARDVLLPPAGEGSVPGTVGESGLAGHQTPTVVLDVHLVRQDDTPRRDSVASRTRSRSQNSTYAFLQRERGSRRSAWRSERYGGRTYVTRRISHSGLGEAASMSLRSMIRQLMTSFVELGNRIDSVSEFSVSNRGASTSTDPDATPMIPSAAQGAAAPAAPALGATAPAAPSLAPGAPAASVAVAPIAGRVEGCSTGSSASSGMQPRTSVSLEEPGSQSFPQLPRFFVIQDDEEEEMPQGLTREQIDNLAMHNFGESDALKVCSVCISDYAEGNKLRKLPCSHEYHVDCIDRWLSENSTCPICRRAVPDKGESVV